MSTLARRTQARERTWQQGALIFLAALVLRLIVAVLSGGTFDPDEFVVLALGHAVAHGQVPYRDLTFFHPPGMLYLIAILQPLVGWWWPTSRIVMLLFDSITAILVWRVGRRLFDNRTALVAGLLYAASPLSLISATRLGPDPIITTLCMVGLVQMLQKRSRTAPILAGISLGLAVWTKYPALLYLPVYILVAPERARRMLLAFGLAVIGLFAPFLIHVREIYTATVVWQVAHRSSSDLVHRFSAVGVYWLGLNCLGLVGLVRRPNPRWLQIGFCSGAVFLFTSQAYYHYFAYIVPFAALLAAPVVRPLFDRSKHLVAAGAIVLTALWGLNIGYGPPVTRLFISASPLSSVQQTAAILDRATSDNSRVLADEFEYALLAHRHAAPDYFWNMQTAVSAHTLERRLSTTSAVVETVGNGDTYPKGFTQYLLAHDYPQMRTGKTIVWLLPDRDTGVAADDKDG